VSVPDTKIEALIDEAGSSWLRLLASVLGQVLYRRAREVGEGEAIFMMPGAIAVCVLLSADRSSDQPCVPEAVTRADCADGIFLPGAAIDVNAPVLMFPSARWSLIERLRYDPGRDLHRKHGEMALARRRPCKADEPAGGEREKQTVGLHG